MKEFVLSTIILVSSYTFFSNILFSLSLSDIFIDCCFLGFLSCCFCFVAASLSYWIFDFIVVQNSNFAVIKFISKKMLTWLVKPAECLWGNLQKHVRMLICRRRTSWLCQWNQWYYRFLCIDLIFEPKWGVMRADKWECVGKCVWEWELAVQHLA